MIGEGIPGREVVLGGGRWVLGRCGVTCVFICTPLHREMLSEELIPLDKISGPSPKKKLGSRQELGRIDQVGPAVTSAAAQPQRSPYTSSLTGEYVTKAEIRTPTTSLDIDASAFYLQLSMHAGSFSQISQFFS